MKTHNILFGTFIILSTTFANALSGAALETEKKKIEGFLVNLGYEDYSSMMKANLAKGNFVHKHAEDKAKTVLVEQIKVYQIFNDSRNLAVDLLGLLKDDKMNSSEAAIALTAFTVQMLKNGPLKPEIDFPESLKSDDEVWHFAWQKAEEKIQRHTLHIAADLVNVLFNKEDELKFANDPNSFPGKKVEFKKARAAMSRIVKFMYLNSALGHTNYLGKALAAGLLREDAINGNKKFETALREKLSQNGLYLENYVGTTLKVTNDEGVISDIEIKNGDFILERSYGMEAWQISFAARPSSSFSTTKFFPYVYNNAALALKKGLMGIPGGNFIHKDDDEENLAGITPMQQKIYENLKEKSPFLAKQFIEDTLPKLEVKKQELTTTKLLNLGVSHAGMAMVKTDPETKISMTWALDVYPNAGLGGIRIMDILAQFAREGHYLRFAVSRHSPEKFYSSVTGNQLYTKNYNFYTGEKEEKEPVLWNTFLSSSEYADLIARGAKNPQAWYDEVMRKSTDHIISEFLGKGLGFSYGFKNAPGQAYCSQMVALSGMQSSSTDFQNKHDTWDMLMQKMKADGHPAAKNIDTDLRIIAPAGFMWQDDIVDPKSISIVNYKILENELEMEEKMFIKDYKAVDDNLIAAMLLFESQAKDDDDKNDNNVLQHIRHNFFMDDTASVAQDQVAAITGVRQIRAEQAHNEALFGDRYSRNSSGFLGSLLNRAEVQRQKQ